MKSIVKILVIVSISSAFSACNREIKMAAQTDQKHKTSWNVPVVYENMKNPVASNSESIADGKSLYILHCKPCHGKMGLGDGGKAALLKTEPINFSKADVQSQTDGVLLYKFSEGLADMPKFKKRIPDKDDVWDIVNYVRTFKH